MTLRARQGRYPEDTFMTPLVAIPSSTEAAQNSICYNRPWRCVHCAVMNKSLYMYGVHPDRRVISISSVGSINSHKTATINWLKTVPRPTTALHPSMHCKQLQHRVMTNCDDWHKLVKLCLHVETITTRWSNMPASYSPL